MMIAYAVCEVYPRNQRVGLWLDNKADAARHLVKHAEQHPAKQFKVFECNVSAESYAELPSPEHIEDPVAVILDPKKWEEWSR